MSTLKNLTQSVTWSLVIAVIIITGFLLGWLMSVFGITAWLDLPTKPLPYMYLHIISRVIFVGILLTIDTNLIMKLYDHDWLSFRQKEETESKDKSEGMFWFVAIAIGFIVFAEFAIRLTSDTMDLIFQFFS